MRKFKLFLIFPLLVLLAGCSFKDFVRVIQKGFNSHYVTYVYNNGEEDYEEIITDEAKARRPVEDPIKNSFTFIGWYLNDELYDFELPVKEDIVLEAKYYYSNDLIEEDVLSANVTVTTTSYKETFGFTTSGSVKTGSGVIYKNEDGVYYCLTNSHVTFKDTNYPLIKYEVTDYEGYTYEANLVRQNVNYDLSIVSFKLEKKLGILNLAGENPNKLESCVAIGQPKGVRNTVTMGKVINYEKIQVEGDNIDSNVLFEVIKHNAKIDNGSSGGALLNSKNEIIGINYAASENLFGYAIPILKVKEFLNMQ